MSIGVSFVISIKNLRAGFQRCYDQIVDISIDVPQAYNILDRWVLGCRQARIINDDIVKKMPCRGRKRFVSKGDGGGGGLIKDSSFFIYNLSVFTVCLSLQSVSLYSLSLFTICLSLQSVSLYNLSVFTIRQSVCLSLSS